MGGFTATFKAIVDRLSDPAIVAEVQSSFGVERVGQPKSSDEPSKLSSHTNGTGTAVRRRKALNEYQLTSDESCTPSAFSEEDTDTEDTLSSDVDAETCGYRINNKFWFYLFTLGTALGDELFYATFIPFWFWNVDGAVGRRMVLVWCINMYIGNYFIIIVGLLLFDFLLFPITVVLLIFRTRYQGSCLLASSWISCHSSSKEMGP